MATIAELFTFMIYTQKPEVSFITSGVQLLDVTNTTFYSQYGHRFIRVVLENATNFVVMIYGQKEFRYTLTNGSWIKNDAVTIVEPWANKKYMIFGDSITQTGDPDNGDFGLLYRDNWWRTARTALKAQSFMNFARSGAAFRHLSGASDWQKIKYQVDYSINQANYTPDVLIIAAGTNDGIGNVGDYDDAMSKSIDSLDLLKSADAMRYSFYKLNQAFPNAIGFVCTPIQRASIDPSELEPFTTLLKKMAGRYGFQVIEVGAESGIVRDFEVLNGAGRDLGDGLHTLVSGKNKMTKVIAPTIKARLS